MGIYKLQYPAACGGGPFFFYLHFSQLLKKKLKKKLSGTLTHIIQIWTSSRGGDYAQPDIPWRLFCPCDSCTRDHRADPAARLEGSPGGWRGCRRNRADGSRRYPRV